MSDAPENPRRTVDVLPMNLVVGAPKPSDPPSDWNTAADAHDLPVQEAGLGALGRYAFPPSAPLDEEAQASSARRWTGQVMLVATIFLLIFNAGTVQNWARLQESGWAQSTIDRLSTVWVDQLALLGADRPLEAMRGFYDDLQNTGFPASLTAPEAREQS